MQLRPIPRIASNEFRPTRLAGEPRVVTGVAATWPAFERWSPEYLKEMVGDQRVHVRERTGAPRNFGQSEEQGGSLPFRVYLDWIVDTSKEYEALEGKKLAPDAIVDAIEQAGYEESYSLDTPLAGLSEALLTDVEAPSWYAVRPKATVLWCSVFGNSSGLHFDVSPNCNVQVRGRKHFVLFAPSQTRFLYRYPDPDAHCAFDPTKPDFARFPRARRARGWECLLEEREALYIPMGWYHQVTVVSPWALNVNFWWPRPFPQGLVTRSVWPQLVWRAKKLMASAIAQRLGWNR
jgi:Cupin-like domain